MVLATVLVQFAQRLAVMELDLRAVLNTMAIGIYVCDGTGTLVFVNDVGLRMLGAASVDELNSRQPRPFQHPEPRDEDGASIPLSRLPLARALSGEEIVRETEVYDFGAHGTIEVRARATPLRDASGAVVGAVKVAVDITREHELATVKDEFIRQVAHELKTPIAVIKANAEAALSGDQTRTPQQLQRLIRGVDRMDALINSLLDLLDIQGGLFSFRRSPVALDRVVAGALERLPERSAQRIRITASTAVQVQCDEARLRRAIHALVDNALKYSPSSEPVEIAMTVTAPTVRVAIRDRGVGIPPDKRQHIFEKYFRAHAGTPNDAGGIGVGLFVAREIVTQHDGRLWFETPEDGGTVFYLELPIHEEARR